MLQQHHATLCRVPSVPLFVLDWLSKESEVGEQYCERFGIDDARELIQKSYRRPQQSDIQTLVVRTEFLTHEAQNALLKILEEPPASTQFVFVVPVSIQLLPTLQSRFYEYVVSKDVPDEVSAELDVFNQFLTSNYCKRLSVTEDNKQNTVWQIAFKQGLLEYLTKTKLDDKELLRTAEYVARKLLTRGASNKMLIEHLALQLPAR